MKEKIIRLLEEKKLGELREELQRINPADLAILLEDLDEKERLLVYRLLPKELAADTFSFMDSDMQEGLINGFTDRELREVLDQTFVDDTVDMIEEMPANVISRILRSADAETREAINQILNYPKDSAGSIMTIEYVKLSRYLSVADAISRIRRVGMDKETIYTCYVTEYRKLIGLVTVKDLLLAEDDQLVGDIMETNVIMVHTHDDKEDVAKQMSKYDFMAMPVVDDENRLVGIVTFDDAIDVLQDETTEDFSKLAAVAPNEDSYFKTSVLKHARSRIGWLLVLMLSATVSGAVLSYYEAAFQAVPLLVSFIPMLMGIGGNCGSQTSTLVIRGLALDEIHIRDFFRIIWKEFRIALIVSLALAVVNGLRIQLTYHDLTISLVVAFSMIGIVILGKLVGGMLPIIAKSLKLDPALMATPLITTILDTCSILIYFGIATHMLSLA
ncbi:MAG TPA: magnesium transporter [Candidatus Ruminococcus avistercoris]|nr:magnesium transporter [Candidatus Ruminococcus avistercoris]